MKILSKPTQRLTWAIPAGRWSISKANYSASTARSSAEAPKTIELQLAGMLPRTTQEGGPEACAEDTAQQPDKTPVFRGVARADVTDDVRTALTLPKDIHGAVIAEIDADSPAGQAGFRER